ncbi:MAG: hypothetical protein NVSMB66_2670 [Candidatus Doudnabacteria bacterium]
MKKSILLISLFFLALGCTKNNPTVKSPIVSDTTTTSATQFYQNPNYGFSFRYPNTFKNTTLTYNNLPNQVVGVGLSSEAYPNTNLGDSTFIVSTKNSKDLGTCLSFTKKEQGSFGSPQTINGAAFYSLQGSGVAAGNIYESKDYRTFKNGNCFEITETIHTSNIGNYPAGTKKEIDKTPLWNQLEAVLKSFQLN